LFLLYYTFVHFSTVSLLCRLCQQKDTPCSDGRTAAGAAYLSAKCFALGAKLPLGGNLPYAAFRRLGSLACHPCRAKKVAVLGWQDGGWRRLFVCQVLRACR
jgi:hypothetical protein